MVVDELLAQLLHLVGVVRGRGAGVDAHLEGAEDFGLGAAAEDADGDLAARQVLLHQHRLVEAPQEVGAHGGQGGRRVDARPGVHPLAGPLGDRFGEQGEAQVAGHRLRQRRHHAKARRGHPGRGHELLGHRLVQGGGARQGIGADVGDAVHLQHGRDLGLAAAAAHSLGDVEHQVPARAGHQALAQGAAVADALHPMAEAAQGPLQLVDGGLGVELGHLLLAIPLRAVVGAQIVDQADGEVHGRGLAKVALTVSGNRKQMMDWLAG
jgi:hypothetical protein